MKLLEYVTEIKPDPWNTQEETTLTVFQDYFSVCLVHAAFLTHTQACVFLVNLMARIFEIKQI